MWELKSKRSGKIEIVTDEQLKAIKNNPLVPIRNFIVTEIKVRSIIPSLKEIPKQQNKQKK